MVCVHLGMCTLPPANIYDSYHHAYMHDAYNLAKRVEASFARKRPSVMMSGVMTLLLYLRWSTSSKTSSRMGVLQHGAIPSHKNGSYLRRTPIKLME